MKKTIQKLMTNARTTREIERIKAVADYIEVMDYNLTRSEFKVLITKTRRSSLEATFERVDALYATKPVTPKTEEETIMNTTQLEYTKKVADKITTFIKAIADKNEVLDIPESVADAVMVMMDDSRVDIFNEVALDKFLSESAETIEGLLVATKPTSTDVNLEGKFHDEILGLIKKTGNTSDTFLFALFNGYSARGSVQKNFIVNTLHYFNDDKVAMAQYFRDLTGKKSSIVKNTGYVTADSIRIVGDALETMIVATVQFTNTYGFQKPAQGIDKLVKRPEELDTNMVKSLFSRSLANMKDKKNNKEVK